MAALSSIGILYISGLHRLNKGYGTIVRLPGINDDSGHKIVMRDTSGHERTIVLGGVFTRGERCGKVDGKLREGSRVEYKLLANGKFCAYDQKTDISGVYIKVLP